MRGQWRKYYETTKYNYLDKSDQLKGLPQPPLVLPAEDENHCIIPLPNPKLLSINKIDLTEAINRRHSVRKYQDIPLTVEELSYLLWTTQGIKEVTKRPATLRTVPSAGSRHAFETFLLINRVKGISPGLYRFLPLEHQLEEISLEEGLPEAFTAACFRQAMVKNCAVTFIWTAVRYRMYWRYGERGLRYLHLDAGHICQNLYLSAEAIKCGVCAIAAFHDDDINALLGLDGEERFTVYVATVGKK